MTKEEAINILNDYDINFERNTAEEVAEAHEMAIEALKAQPSEDCISRKAAIEGLASIAKAKAKSDTQKSLMGRVMFFTEHLPSVTPQPEKHTEERTKTHECDKVGHWIGITRGKDITLYVNSEGNLTDFISCKCSECNEWLVGSDKYICSGRYCPSCGAKMQEVKK